MVLMVAAVSLIAPASLAWIGTWVINPMLGIIMFGMGLTLSPQDFKIVLSRPKDILIGCLTQFTVMPLLAWGLTWAFSLPQELAIGVILVGCCPGGTASNVITYLAKGDLALGRHDGRCAYNRYADEHRLYRYSSHRQRTALPTLHSKGHTARHALPAGVLVDCGGADRRYRCGA